MKAARRLRHYFLAHTIAVCIDQPVKQLLGQSDMVGRMLKWSLELSEFDIKYKVEKSSKAHIMADFIAEMTLPASPAQGTHRWTMFVDGASNSTESGVGIILKNWKGVFTEVSLSLTFPTSNNQPDI